MWFLRQLRKFSLLSVLLLAVLFCNNPVSSLFIYHCLVWISHQTDSQDCLIQNVYGANLPPS